MKTITTKTTKSEIFTCPYCGGTHVIFREDPREWTYDDGNPFDVKDLELKDFAMCRDCFGCFNPFVKES